MAADSLCYYSIGNKHISFVSVGESSGKASNWVAKYSAGSSGMAQTQERAGGACSEISRAKMVLSKYG